MSFEVLRLRMQRVISENRIYRVVYRNNLSLLPTQMNEEDAKNSSMINADYSKPEPEKKWRKKIHRLQLQLQHVTEELNCYKKECGRLQFDSRLLRKQLIRNSCIPVIRLKYDYLWDLQQYQLHIVDKMFQHNQYLLCEYPSDMFCKIVTSELEIPGILVLCILRKYSLFIHTCRFNKPCPTNYGKYQNQEVNNHSSFSTGRAEGSNQVVLYQFPPLSSSSSSSFEQGVNICTVEHQAFSDWWKLSFLGYDNKERLFHCLCNKDVVTFNGIKQMICDFLYWNKDVQISIHNAYLTSCANEFVLCYHHYIYITTVATAILFNLTGLLSLMVGKREFMHSNLFSILQLLDKKPIAVILPFAPTYSQQIFTRFQSLCDKTDKETINQCCSTDPTNPLGFHQGQQLTITASNLLNSMNPKLSNVCFFRAFSKIQTLLNIPKTNQIEYEAYVMFNILYNV